MKSCNRPASASLHSRSNESNVAVGIALPQYGTIASPESMLRVAEEAEKIGLSSLWSFVRKIDSAQMVCNTQMLPPVDPSFEELNISHVDEMLALVELAKPGPFSKRTPELGSYLGIREAGQLVAMAGERLKPHGHTEISAVCTHPDYRGRGYASSLVSILIKRITERNEIPFLHVRNANADAIRVYEKLGFKTRRTIDITVVKNEESAQLSN